MMKRRFKRKADAAVHKFEKKRRANDSQSFKKEKMKLR